MFDHENNEMKRQKLTLLITFDQLEEEVPMMAQTMHQKRQEGEQEVSSKASMNTVEDGPPFKHTLINSNEPLSYDVTQMARGRLEAEIL